MTKKTTTKTNKGFTLAELLVAMLLIAILAILVVSPTKKAISDYMLKGRLKSAYQALVDATDKIVEERLIDENKPYLTNLCASTDNNCLMNLYKPYLKYIDSCNDGTAAGNCWASSSYFLDGSGFSAALNNRSALMLSNGISVLFQNDAMTSCNGYALDICAWVNVDLNGPTAPNKIGIDIFRFWIRKNTFSPFGVPGENHTASTLCDGVGEGCAIYYLKGN